MSVEAEVKKEMQQAVDHLHSELKNLRTGRANPGLLDSVHVEVYGSSMRLRDIANVTVPEPRQLLVTPFDMNNLPLIAKGIEAANLNLNPQVEKSGIRIPIPPMDEALRKEIVKQCWKKGEETKIVIREIRRKKNDLVRKQKADGEIPEDLLKKEEKTIQTLTDQFCKGIDDSCKEKEKEILSI